MIFTSELTCMYQDFYRDIWELPLFLLSFYTYNWSNLCHVWLWQQSIWVWFCISSTRLDTDGELNQIVYSNQCRDSHTRTSPENTIRFLRALQKFDKILYRKDNLMYLKPVEGKISIDPCRTEFIWGDINYSCDHLSYLNINTEKRSRAKCPRRHLHFLRNLNMAVWLHHRDKSL